MKLFTNNFSAINGERGNKKNVLGEKKINASIRFHLMQYCIFILTVLLVTTSSAQVVTFNFTGVSGYGASPLTPTSSNANVDIVGLTRGSGVATTGSPASNAWGGVGFTATSQAAAITANQFATFTITAKTGYTVSLSNIPAYNIRRSGTGPTTGIWQYKVGSGSFTDIGSQITWGGTTSASGNNQPAITLSGIPALQNVSSSNTVTFRIVTWGGASTGTWYFNAGGSNPILTVNGTVNPVTAPPVVSGASLTGTVGTLFTTYQVSATNGPISSYVIASGSLPPGLSFSTVNGQITGTPTSAGPYSINVNATNAAGTSVSPGTINFTINPGNQTITGLAASNTKTYGDAPYNITGVTGGGSGNAVTFASSNTAVATIVGNTVTITGAGVTTITASQLGNANWNAATDVTQTLTVGQATQTITFAPLPDKNDIDPDFALTATASSGLPVSYVSSNTAVATIVSGNMVHIVASGTTTITASQPGNTNYTAAADVSRFQNILSTALLDQQIVFDPLANKIYGDADFQLTATGGASGNPVIYISSNTSVATIVGDMVTIVGPGTTTITASQAGNAFYNPAPDVTQDFTVDTKELTVIGAVADNKIYDLTTAATISGSTLVGLVGSDVVTISGTTGTFADPNVANGIAVTAGLTLTGADAFKYSLTQPTGLTANITKADQVITFAALPNKFVGDADFNLTATASSNIPVTYTNSNPLVATITGSLVHIVAIGSTTITAEQAGDNNYNPAISVQQVQNVVPTLPVALVTFDFTPLTGGSNNFGPSPLTPTSGNANVTNVGLTRGSGVGTTGTGAGKAWGGNNFTATSQAAAIAANQFATFSITANPGYTVSLSGIPAYNIRRSNTGSTTGIWQYKVGSGSFTDIGTAITWGSIVTNLGNDQGAINLSGISALQYVPSTSTITLRLVAWGGSGATGTWYLNEPGANTRILKVNGFVDPVPALPPVVTSANLTGAITTLFSTYTVLATNGPILSYAIASGTLPPGLSFNTTNGQITGTPTSAGIYSIDVTATNAAGTSVAPGIINFNISKGDQVITGLPATDTKTYGDAPYAITGVTGGASGNAVTFASSDPLVATISGNTVTITGAGVTTITASQLGNTDWNDAPNVTQTLTVNQAAQTITFAPLPDKNDTDADFALTATASSGLPVTYVSSNPAVATIVSGNMVHIIAAGTTTITASQSGNINYTPAADVSQAQNILNTTLLNQTITFGPLSNKTYGDAAFQLTASASSGLTVSYQSSNTTVATVSGDIVTIIGPGTTIITASQAGNGSYNPAPNVTQNFTVDVKPLTVTGATADNKVYDGTTAATISGATLVGVEGLDVVSITGFTGTFTDANVATGIAVTAGLTLGGADALKYSIVQPAGLTANISKADQTITFTALPDRSLGTADFNLTATASSALPVSYTSSAPIVATVTGSLVHLVNVGSTTITAEQPGDLNYNAAISVQQIQNVLTPVPVSLVTFDFTSLIGGINTFGPSPLPATASDANIAVVGLTRGIGIGTTGTGASKAWGGTGFSTSIANQADAISGNQVVVFTITANPGYTVSLSDIPAYNIRRSGSGPTTGIWQYQVGPGSFTDIGSAITWGTVTSGLGNDQVAINLSAITALQNVPSSNTITLRVVLWGATGTAGTWYFNEPATSSRILRVNGNALQIPPVATFTGLPTTICSSASAVTLTGTPAGGTFTGPGISGNTFDPAVAGPGTHSITYAVAGYTSSTQQVTVTQPVVSFTGLAASYCIDATTVTLTGNQAPGGLFTGTGITDNGNGTAIFNPALAGAGIYNITYTYADINSCSVSSTQSVTVNPLPVVSFTGLAAVYCTTDAAVTLTGNPAGGVFSGTGIVGNIFDPAIAGAGGPYTITYTYTDASTGCSNSSTQQVTVNVCATGITVNLKLWLQGYYLNGGSMQPVMNNQTVPLSLATETDSITIELHDPTTFALVDTKPTVLLTDGTVSANFTQPAGSYYIAIKHRNSVQTWSTDPIACSVSSALYDFSINANKAMGNNQAEVEPGVWAIYMGDMNQDDYIDGNDFPLYDFESASGGLYDGTYTTTDINGDGFVDGNDFPVFDLNSSNSISAVHP